MGVGRLLSLRSQRTSLLPHLQPASEEFRRLWALYDARPSRGELKRFSHQVAGELSLRRQAFAVGGAEQQVLIVYQSVLGSASEDALRRLV